MQMWVIWLIIAILLLVSEMATLTFYLLWLGIGALAALVVSLVFPESWVLQVLFGGGTAVLLTIFTKPLTARWRQAKGYSDIIDHLVGKEGLVIEDIGPASLGIVKIGSETWSAKSDRPLVKGQRVIVTNRESTMLVVQPL